MDTESDRIQKKLSLLEESYRNGLIDSTEYEKHKQQLLDEQKSSEAEGLVEAKDSSQPEKKPDVASDDIKAEKEKPEPEKPAPEILTEPESSEKKTETSKEDETGEEKPPIETPKTEEVQEEKTKTQEEEKEKKDSAVVGAPLAPKEAEKPEEQPLSDSPKKEEPKKEESKPQEQQPEKKRSWWKTLLWIVVFIAIIFFLYLSSLNVDSDNGGSNETSSAAVIADQEEEPVIVCNEDTDCAHLGPRGTCENPGTEASECIEVFEPVEVTVFTSTDCATCDTTRMNGLLMNWFPSASFEEIVLADESDIVEEYGLKMLPAYFVEGKLETFDDFDGISRIFEAQEDGYLVKDSASGATYVIDRQTEANHVTVFSKSNDLASGRGLRNIQPVLTAIESEGGTVEFATESDTAYAALDEPPLPFVLINNKVMQLGVVSAQTFQEEYCAYNDADLCDTEFSSGLVE